MDLEKTPQQEQDAREYLYHRSFVKFATSTAVIVLLLLSHFFSDGTKKEPPTPTQDTVTAANTLNTIVGRKIAIDEKYHGAKIIKERTYGKDIISVFTVDDRYSFCVFEALEDGYWMEYCGNLFPKTELVKGTVYLGDNTHEYDIYLQHETNYSHLLVTRTNRKYHKLKQKQHVRFDENGIGIMKLDPGRYYPNPRIEAFDAEGNRSVLDDGRF